MVTGLGRRVVPAHVPVGRHGAEEAEPRAGEKENEDTGDEWRTRTRQGFHHVGIIRHGAVECKSQQTTGTLASGMKV